MRAINKITVALHAPFSELQHTLPSHSHASKTHKKTIVLTTKTAFVINMLIYPRDSIHSIICCKRERSFVTRQDSVIECIVSNTRENNNNLSQSKMQSGKWDSSSFHTRLQWKRVWENSPRESSIIGPLKVTTYAFTSLYSEMKRHARLLFLEHRSALNRTFAERFKDSSTACLFEGISWV